MAMEMSAAAAMAVERPRRAARAGWLLLGSMLLLLLGLLLLFSWMHLVGVVRAEFLRARNFDYVKAARACFDDFTQFLIDQGGENQRLLLSA